jgi:4-hydroxy-tetrahydrodipicolinate reductase
VTLRVAVAGEGLLRVAVAGASGRMGRLLVEQVLAAPDLQLVAALAPAGSAAQGQDAAAHTGQPCGVRIGTELGEAQVLIDFTRVEGTLAHAALCRRSGCALVAGTTGFSAAQMAELEQAAQHIPLLWAPNTSLGVNVVMQLLAQAAARLGPEYDVEIVEAHHRHKVDAPSGTALQMGEVIATARGEKLADVQTLSREGHTGARERGRIGFATVRGGDIVGDHQVMFCGEGERIEIAHRSSSRLHYAQGALTAARFLAAQKPGRLYRMADVVASLGRPGA